MPKKVTKKGTSQINYRVPEAIVHDIDILVENGFFKDRADFSYQATIAFLDQTKAKLAGRIIEFMIPLETSDE